MNRWRMRGFVVGALAIAAGHVAAAEPPEFGPGSLVDRYCNKCHNTTDWAGGVAFDTLSVDSFAQDSETWEHAVRMLRGGLMPPPGQPRPGRIEQQAFVAQME